MPYLFESGASLPSLDGPASALKHATDCDMCLLIVGARYGQRDESHATSFTHQEYLAARNAGKPVFAFIHQETLVKLELYKARQNPDFWSLDEAALFNFVIEIGGDQTRFSFSTLPELKRSIRHQLVSYYGYLLRSYSEVEAIRPTTSNNWYNIGFRFWNAARFSQAIFCYRKAIEADAFGDAGGAVYKLGEALRICGRPQEALEVLETGLKRFPLNSINILMGITTTLFELDRPAEALRTAEQLASDFPDDSRPWDALRYVYSRLKMYDKAADAAKKAFEIAPEQAGLRGKATTFERFLRGRQAAPSESLPPDDTES